MRASAGCREGERWASFATGLRILPWQPHGERRSPCGRPGCGFAHLHRAEQWYTSAPAISAAHLAKKEAFQRGRCDPPTQGVHPQLDPLRGDVAAECRRHRLGAWPRLVLWARQPCGRAVRCPRACGSRGSSAHMHAVCSRRIRSPCHGRSLCLQLMCARSCTNPDRTFTRSLRDSLEHSWNALASVCTAVLGHEAARP